MKRKQKNSSTELATELSGFAASVDQYKSATRHQFMLGSILLPDVWIGKLKQNLGKANIPPHVQKSWKEEFGAGTTKKKKRKTLLERPKELPQ